MDIDAISIGRNPPDEVNVLIEVPIGGEPIKYEIDKKAGTLVVDRFLYTPMRYPGNYGFIPHTLSQDGDPCDVLVANTRPITPGAVIAVRPIGVLRSMHVAKRATQSYFIELFGHASCVQLMDPHALVFDEATSLHGMSHAVTGVDDHLLIDGFIVTSNGRYAGCGRVTDLLRVRIGPLEIGELPEGRWRPLAGEERAALLRPPAAPSPAPRPAGPAAPPSRAPGPPHRRSRPGKRPAR